MTRKALFTRLACLALIAALGLIPLAAQAEDTDPQGEKLKKILGEYLRTAPANDEKAQKLRAMKANDSFGWELLCLVEQMNLPGDIIWTVRFSKDKCNYDETEETSYCTKYSEHCNHYHWTADCMKSKGCPALR